jgi:hypothetical protein
LRQLKINDWETEKQDISWGGGVKWYTKTDQIMSRNLANNGASKKGIHPKLRSVTKKLLGKSFFVGLFVTIRMTGVFRGNHF